MLLDIVYAMNVLFVLFVICMLSCGVGTEFTSKSIPSVTEYFPELNGDLTKVNWAHAVNNQSLLNNALEDKNVMMVEADVVLGTVIGTQEVVPIMAHPPKNSSDLSLAMFIEKVINAQAKKRKGIKLDFKSTESFNSSWKVIDPLTNKINFPVLLNADILQGPVNSDVKPVDPEIFLKLSSQKFPTSTLSIGWTTKFQPGMDGFYTEDQLNKMKNVIENNNIKQPVTLCVRAGIAAKSYGIRDLVKNIDEYQKSNRTSITVWMSTNTDPVDIPKLRDLILSVNKSKVFLDVPKFISDELALDKNSARSPISAAQGALVALLTSVSAIFSKMF